MGEETNDDDIDDTEALSSSDCFFNTSLLVIGFNKTR